MFNRQGWSDLSDDGSGDSLRTVIDWRNKNVTLKARSNQREIPLNHERRPDSRQNGFRTQRALPAISHVMDQGPLLQLGTSIDLTDHEDMATGNRQWPIQSTYRDNELETASQATQNTYRSSRTIGSSAVSTDYYHGILKAIKENQLDDNQRIEISRALEELSADQASKRYYKRRAKKTGQYLKSCYGEANYDSAGHCSNSSSSDVSSKRSFRSERCKCKKASYYRSRPTPYHRNLRQLNKTSMSSRMSYTDRYGNCGVSRNCTLTSIERNNGHLRNMSLQTSRFHNSAQSERQSSSQEACRSRYPRYESSFNKTCLPSNIHPESYDCRNQTLALSSRYKHHYRRSPSKSNVLPYSFGSNRPNSSIGFVNSQGSENIAAFANTTALGRQMDTERSLASSLKVSEKTFLAQPRLREQHPSDNILNAKDKDDFLMPRLVSKKSDNLRKGRMEIECIDINEEAHNIELQNSEINQNTQALCTINQIHDQNQLLCPEPINTDVNDQNNPLQLSEPNRLSVASNVSKRLSNIEENPESSQNSSDFSMRPSFIRRKLFTQTLDVVENKQSPNKSNDSLLAVSANFYSSDAKNRNRSRMSNQKSYLSGVNLEEDNESTQADRINLIQKIVAPDKPNVTSAPTLPNLITSSLRSLKQNGVIEPEIEQSENEVNIASDASTPLRNNCENLLSQEATSTSPLTVPLKMISPAQITANTSNPNQERSVCCGTMPAHYRSKPTKSFWDIDSDEEIIYTKLPPLQSSRKPSNDKKVKDASKDLTNARITECAEKSTEMKETENKESSDGQNIGGLSKDSTTSLTATSNTADTSVKKVVNKNKDILKEGKKISSPDVNSKNDETETAIPSNNCAGKKSNKIVELKNMSDVFTPSPLRRSDRCRKPIVRLTVDSLASAKKYDDYLSGRKRKSTDNQTSSPTKYGKMQKDNTGSKEDVGGTIPKITKKKTPSKRKTPSKTPNVKNKTPISKRKAPNVKNKTSNKKNKTSGSTKKVDKKDATSQKSPIKVLKNLSNSRSAPVSKEDTIKTKHGEADSVQVITKKQTVTAENKLSRTVKNVQKNNFLVPAPANNLAISPTFTSESVTSRPSPNKTVLSNKSRRNIISKETYAVASKLSRHELSCRSSKFNDDAHSMTLRSTTTTRSRAMKFLHFY